MQSLQNIAVTQMHRNSVQPPAEIPLPIRQPGDVQASDPLKALKGKEEAILPIKEQSEENQRAIIERKPVSLEERMKQVLSAEDIKMILYLASGIQPVDPSELSGQKLDMLA